MAKRILMILIRAKAEKQIPFIRATSASAPPNDYLKKILFFELKKNLSKTLKISQLVIMIQSVLRVVKIITSSAVLLVYKIFIKGIFQS